MLAVAAASAAASTAACGDKRAATRADSTANSTANSTAGAPVAVATDTVKRQGSWSDSVTAESDYTAAYVHSQLVVIEEQMVFPDGMRSSRAYFYGQSAAPTRIIDERTLTAASGNSSPTTVRARLDVYLTGDRVDSSGKMVDNVAKTVQPYEIDNLRRHEREIFARVSTTNSAPRTNR